MKTAMQELIDYVKETWGWYEDFEIKSDQLLEKEKEQIIKAYLKGDSNGCGCYDYATKEDAEEYYNQTYDK